jgi:predicted amidohydrolase
MARVAVIQRPPVFLDRSATLENAVAAVREAAGREARLVVFPETFVPGYPAWMWRLRPLHEEHGLLYAEIDLERVGMARRSLDVVGHYARPDLFQLHVDSRPQKPLHVQL